MLRDNLVELIEPMLNSAGADPLALYIHTRTPASDDRLPCLKNPRPEGAESSLTESASSPFQAEPAQKHGACARCQKDEQRLDTDDLVSDDLYLFLRDSMRCLNPKLLGIAEVSLLRYFQQFVEEAHQVLPSEVVSNQPDRKDSRREGWGRELK